MIKKLFILTMATVAFIKYATAQNGFSQMAVTAGMSTTNSKYLSLSLETSSNSYNIWGLTVDGIFYANKQHSKLSWETDNKILSLGIYYKGKLSSTKNFNSTFFIGGSGGTDNSNFIYYPFGGFEENFFLSPVWQLTFNQKVLYLFGDKKMVHWQPILNIGFKLSL